jgi:hypothetical protein
MSTELEAPYTEIFNKLKKIDEHVREEISYGVPNGLYCTDLAEGYGSRNQADCENIREGKHGQQIVFGRDREGTLVEGKGAQGAERAGMIDIYVGPGASLEKNNKKFDKNDRLDPFMLADAARVYITQASDDIDKCFGIKSSSTSIDSNNKSAVALKADHIRIIGSEKIVLFAGPANRKEKLGMFPDQKERNSNGDKIEGISRIELLTGHPEHLEPVVRGEKLVEYLKKRNEAHVELVNKIDALNKQLSQINMVLNALTVGAPPFSKNMIDNIVMIFDNITQSFNSYIDEVNSLNETSITGADSILSNTVFTS